MAPGGCDRGVQDAGASRGFAETQRFSPLTQKRALPAHHPVLVRQQLPIPLVAREADSHLGHDAREHRTEPFVQPERRLALDDFGAGPDEATMGCLCGFCLSISAGWWEEEGMGDGGIWDVRLVLALAARAACAP